MSAAEDAPVYVMVDRDGLIRDLQIVAAHLSAVRHAVRTSGGREDHAKSLRLMIRRLDEIAGEL